MAWTPPKDAVLAEEKGWKPPADAIAVESKPQAAPVQEKTGVALGKKAVEAGKDVSKGFFEPVATAVTGTASTIAGDALGISLAAANKVRGALGLEPTRVRNLATGEMTSDAAAAARGVKEAGTYQPRTQSGQAANKVLETLATPITKTARFAGDVVEGATGSELAGDVASDIANAVIGAKVIKIAPKAASATVDIAKKGASVAGKGLEVANKVYSPERQMAAAGGHLMAGDIGGAAAQATMAVARKTYEKVRGGKTSAASEAAPASVGEMIAEPGLVPGVTTKAQAAEIRNYYKQQRAESMARNKAGRNVESTF
jgi:hypothetical protein